jgi:hypothetical protein
VTLLRQFSLLTVSKVRIKINVSYLGILMSFDIILMYDNHRTKLLSSAFGFKSGHGYIRMDRPYATKA